MRGYMFRNRWLALLFVCITLAGVTKLVGTADHQGTIQQAAGEIAAQKAQADKLTTDTQQVAENVSAEPPLADDEDLIDDAVGEDPTPIDEFAAANPSAQEEPVDEIVIVSREVAGQAETAQPVAVPVQ